MDLNIHSMTGTKFPYQGAHKTVPSSSPSRSNTFPAPAPVSTCKVCYATSSDPSATPPPGLQKCAKCRSTLYCTRACQVADWPVHKTICRKPGAPNAGSASASVLSGSGDTYLHSFTKRGDVYAQLTDSFRMRVQDELTFAGVRMGCMRASGSDLHRVCEEDFGRFLDLAESRSGLLPGWWREGGRAHCESFAKGPVGGNFEASRMSQGNIYTQTQKNAIQEHWGDSLMPMKLRLLAERIYARGFM